MQDSGLTCPNCNGKLFDTYAEATYGRVLLLEQCGTCGGVWFDQWELYLIKEAEARKLDLVNKESLASFIPHQKGDGVCPKCSAKLEKFNDPALPPDSLILRCTACSGLWLNRGELSKYGDHKEALLGNQRRSTQTYLPVSPDEERIEALKRLGNSLNIGPISNLEYKEPEPVFIDSPEEYRKDVTSLALQILLRLLTGI